MNFCRNVFANSVVSPGFFRQGIDFLRYLLLAAIILFQRFIQICQFLGKFRRNRIFGIADNFFYRSQTNCEHKQFFLFGKTPFDGFGTASQTVLMHKFGFFRVGIFYCLGMNLLQFGIKCRHFSPKFPFRLDSVCAFFQIFV